MCVFRPQGCLEYGMTNTMLRTIHKVSSRLTFHAINFHMRLGGQDIQTLMFFVVVVDSHNIFPMMLHCRHLQSNNHVHGFGQIGY